MCRDGNTNAVTISLDDGTYAPLTSGARTVQSLSAGSDRQSHLYIVSEPTRPTELRLLEGGEERTVFTPNEWLDEYELAEPVPRTCVRDGLELPYWLLMPAGEESVPVILEIHGGPNNEFSNCFYFDQQLWAAQGYAVVYGNPRGSYGYSREFYNGCLNDLVGEDAQDVLAMLDDAIAADSRVDAERATVTGYSYGGYMTNQIVAITDRFKAAASGAGITNLFSWVATADIGRWFEKMYLGGTATERQQHYIERSPVLQAGRIRTPLLIFHGERDTRVPVSQAEEMLYAVLEQGVDASLLRLPGDDHGGIRRVGVGMSSPKHQLAVRHAVIDWFDRYTSDE
jgi:dipeptidyl aminopeptidase/acylaminoacyl peptidase